MTVARDLLNKIRETAKDSCENECGRQLKCLKEKCVVYRILERLDKAESSVVKEESKVKTLEEELQASNEAKNVKKRDRNSSLYDALKRGGRKNG